MDIREELSKAIGGVHGVGWLTPILREALFGEGASINWEAVRETWNVHNPDRRIEKSEGQR